MPWIAPEEIEQIKRAVDIVPLVRERGVELKKHGSDLIGLCPFHHDVKTPNFVVTPSKNLYHCFGCDNGGSNIDFVMNYDKVSFRHAVEKLRGNGDLVSFSPLTVKDSTNGIKTQKLLNRVADYYHKTFLKEQEGQRYLRERDTYSPAAIKRFKIGYANRTLGYVVPRDSEWRKPLQEAGIFNRETGHEFFSGCVIFSIMDFDGNVTEMYGRKTNEHRGKNVARHLYLPGPHRGVWNAGVFTSNREIILCESAIDALTFFVNGFLNVTFSYGVSGFTDEHLQLMKEHGITTVFNAYDNDKSGNRAAKKLADRLAKEGITTYRLRFPPGMDANLYARKVTPATKSLAILFQEPQLLAGKSTPLVVPIQQQTTAKEVKEKETDANVSPVSSDAGPVQDVLPEAAKGAIEKEANVSPASSDAGPAPDVLPAAAKEENGGDVSVTDGPAKKLDLRRQKNGVFITMGDRKYRVRGLEKNKSYEVMKVSIRISRNGCYFLDSLDMVQERQRRIFIKNASDDLELNADIAKRDLGTILCALEDIQEEILEETDQVEENEYHMTEAERRAALAYLKSPDIIRKVIDDFHTCGIVKEDTILLAGYLATLSRKFDDPLAIMFQSSPGSGKSTVMEAILDFVPDEDKRVYTYMTGQSLFYSGENELKHKVLAIEEDEGAEKASYSLKVMQSEKRISIQSTGTDPQTGRNKSFTTTVNGPVAIMSCTTKPFVEEELMLRFLGVGVDESRQQTMAVLKRQRENETMSGMLKKEKARQLKHLHRNIQRLLLPVRVINTYANQLTFPSNNLRTRRDQKKYLILIRAIAFLFQYQRRKKTMMLDGSVLEYIEVTPSDINHAYQLACEIMGRSLDELAPQTRNLLNMQVEMVRKACERLCVEKSDYRYGQKDIREYTGWSAYQVKVHQYRLVDLEYVYCHKGRNGRLYEYELVYDGEGDQGKRFVMGISNVEAVRGKAVSSQPSAISLKREKEEIRSRKKEGPKKQDPRPSTRDKLKTDN